MKFQLVMFCLLLNLDSMAQSTFLQKKIGQRRDIFVNNNWQGVDSSTWNYNSNNDSTFRQYNSFTNNTWSPINRNWFYYGSNNKISYYVREVFNNGAFVPVNKFESNYDANNNELEQIQYGYANNIWNLKSKVTKIFSAKNKPLSETLQTYTNGNWLNSALSTYTYDPTTDSLGTSNAFSWVNGKWSNVAKKIIFWNAFGKPIITYSYYGAYDTAWLKESYNTYFYDLNSNLRKAEYKVGTFILPDSIWLNSAKDTFFYNAGFSKPYKQINFIPDVQNNWINNYANEYTYNADTNLIEHAILKGNNLTIDSFVNFTFNSKKKIDGIRYAKYINGTKSLVGRDTFYFDNNNNVIYNLTQKNANGWINSKQAFYYYNNYPLLLNKFEAKNMLVYPNPALNTLCCNIGLNGLVNVSIMDYMGRVVLQSKEQAANGSIIIPITNLANGNYVIQITAGKNKYLGKFSVAK